jgi:hypothetical protein
MSIRRAAFVPAVMAAALMAVASPAMASTAPTAPAPRAQPAVNPTWTEYRGVHKTFEGDHSGDWVHCEYVTKANYVQTAGCSRGKTVSTGISYTFGFSDGEISEAVGFNVSFSTTVTASNSVTIEPGGSGWFDVGFRYAEYKIGMEKRVCSRINCLPWSKPKTVTVQKHLGGTFHYFGTGAEK